MFDTIRARCEWILNPGIAKLLNRDGLYCRDGWYLESHPSQTPGPRGIIQQLKGFNEELGIRVYGKDTTIERVQCSLPRLLHGYNGRMIRNPNELKKAQGVLFARLWEISEAKQELIEFTRLDLVLNFPANPRKLIVAHKNARHPWVRRAQVEYGDSTIRFPGKQIVMHLYSKQKERADKSGFNLPSLSNSVRAELQIKGKSAVRRFYGNDDHIPVVDLDFFLAYSVFRDAWCKFDSKSDLKSFTKKCSLHALVAECEAQNFITSFGMYVWDWFADGKKATTIARLRSMITAHKHEAMQFSWSELLPEFYGQKPLVDISCTGKEIIVEHPW